MPIDRKIKDRCIKCDGCGKTRNVTYTQEWNIKKGKCNNFCLSCASKNGDTIRNIGNKRASGEILSKAFKKSYREGKRKIPDYTGDKNPSWKGGITKKSTKIRNSKKYLEWRTTIFERDNYTCLSCLKVGGKLEVHHINEFAKFEEYRFDIDNGVTLCYDCHKLIHSKIYA